MHRKIIIVGAGMAGLGAAHQFTNNNFRDFLVIEAQNQPGGRIRTMSVYGKPLDTGAQWLHGKDNPLYELASAHNLLADEMSEEGSGKYVRNDGVIFDEFLVKRVDWEVGKILEECQTFLNKEDFPKSVGEFLKQKFTEYLDNSDDSSEVREMKLQLLDWHTRFQVIDNSCESLNKLSAKWWGVYICEDDTAHYNLKHGFGSLVQAIVDHIPQENMLFNTSLQKIQADGSPIKLICDNRTLTCDHLILTISLGVLKEYNFFNSGPPLVIKESITNMGFHSIAKIYLFFSEKWWGETKGFQLLWGSEEVLDDNERWIRDVTGFEELYGHSNCLLGWVGGAAVQVVEELGEEEVGAVCVKFLRKFLLDYRVPDPIKVIRNCDQLEKVLISEEKSDDIFQRLCEASPDSAMTKNRYY